MKKNAFVNLQLHASFLFSARIRFQSLAIYFRNVFVNSLHFFEVEKLFEHRYFSHIILQTNGNITKLNLFTFIYFQNAFLLFFAFLFSFERMTFSDFLSTELLQI